jgi:hypothetical protein
MDHINFIFEWRPAWRLKTRFGQGMIPSGNLTLRELEAMAQSKSLIYHDLPIQNAGFSI